MRSAWGSHRPGDRGGHPFKEVGREMMKRSNVRRGGTVLFAVSLGVLLAGCCGWDMCADPCEPCQANPCDQPNPCDPCGDPCAPVACDPCTPSAPVGTIATARESM